jgi:hypothetical protein
MSEQNESVEVHDPALDYQAEEVPAPHDETDVPDALDEETDDGKGGAVVPKADFESYADPSADKEETS